MINNWDVKLPGGTAWSTAGTKAAWWNSTINSWDEKLPGGTA
jgi:hypothetical protein